ncbi:hypothetical protein KV112_20595 [Mycolicibacter sp. MYC123]|uniref:DUF2550 domain-containing protein n=1 Tax=[Mycobacterium] zoologicum TaxID=2872311 RepID=A0ABU5YPW1_9MYCO|nr:hypothetical protein [Mycolicibacter sp. MYC123]MEB3052114.1 hypothetical protein [Mycolicibacter sp. MYC123]
MATLLVALLALLTSATALLIAWWQLALQRHAAGGRGVIFNVSTPMRTIDRSDGTERISDGYRIWARLIGNDRHEVTLHIERDGQPVDPSDLGIDPPPPLRHRWTCQDEPIRWNFDLAPELAHDLWCVLLWVDPYGEGIRTGGFRRQLGNDPQFQRWHWFRFFSARRRFETWASQTGPAWFRTWAGRPRRLGEWKPHRNRPLQQGQSPLNSTPYG